MESFDKQLFVATIRNYIFLLEENGLKMSVPENWENFPLDRLRQLERRCREVVRAL